MQNELITDLLRGNGTVHARVKKIQTVDVDNISINVDIHWGMGDLIPSIIFLTKTRFAELFAMKPEFINEPYLQSLVHKDISFYTTRVTQLSNLEL